MYLFMGDIFYVLSFLFVNRQNIVKYVQNYKQK